MPKAKTHGESRGFSILLVKVIPKARQNSIVGWEGERLKVKLMAVPEKGAANDALIALLAKKFDIPKSSMQIIKGETSRQKSILIKENVCFESLSFS